MTLTTKFKKDISTLRAAANKEIYLDVKNPKLYKKVSRYYVGEGLVELSGEDPDDIIRRVERGEKIAVTDGEVSAVLTPSDEYVKLHTTGGSAET